MSSIKQKQSREELLRIAKARLYPPLTDPNYLVLRRRRLILSKWVEAIAGDQLMVLDVGGRYQPYRSLLEPRATQYVALDVQRTPLVDVLASGEHLPFSPNTFDVVLATAVFEYLREPRAAAAEIHRVLKPGGYLMMSVAAIFPRVAEEEYWRFLPAGLRLILASFAKVEVAPEVSSLGGAIRLNAWLLSSFAKPSFLREIVNHTIVPVLNLAGLGLEGFGITNNDQAAGNYSVLAHK